MLIEFLKLYTAQVEVDVALSPYWIKDEHLRQEVDCSVRDVGREGVQFLEGAGFSLGEETLDSNVRGNVGHVFATGGSQDVCYHLQLMVKGRGEGRGREGESRERGERGEGESRERERGGEGEKE